MASSGSSEMKDKFETLKMDIRAILVSANEGLTPDMLNRDYMDIYGQCIPFNAFGFPSMYHMLDAMNDTVDAFQTANNTVVLFAKSTKQTRHMESLISRQRKAARVGRFGGIIQKPPEECRGTKERRELITNRLFRVVSNQPPDYIKSADLFRLYEAKYGEKLDASDDFYCTPKGLFEVKLSKYFDVRDMGRGGFWIRLKDEEREKILGGTNVAASSRPSTPGLSSQSKTQEPSQKAPVQLVTDALSKSTVDVVPISDHQRKKDISSSFPPGPAISFARAMAVATHSTLNCSLGGQQEKQNSNITKLVESQNISPPMADSDNILAYAAAKLDELMVNTAPMVTMDTLRDTTQRSTPPGPTMVNNPNTTLQSKAISSEMVAEDNGAARGSQVKSSVLPVGSNSGYNATTTTPAGVPSPMEKNSGTAQGENTVNTPGFKENLRRVLAVYSNGVELSAFQWAYYIVSGELMGDDNGALVSLLNECSTVCELVKKNEMSYLVKSKPEPPAYVAPKVRPVSERDHLENVDKEQFKKRPMTGLTAKLRPDADQRGTGCHSDRSIEVRQQVDEEARRLAVEELKINCRKVLHACPAGVTYLNFPGAYKEIIGKSLDLNACGLLSVMDLVDEMPELVVTEHSANCVLGLKERTVETTMNTAEESDLNKENKDEEYSEEELMQLVWSVIMTQPSKSLSLQEIPSSFQEVTGLPFPIEDLDNFGLQICEYIDRFSCTYTDDSLYVLAEPEWACLE